MHHALKHVAYQILTTSNVPSMDNLVTRLSRVPLPKTQLSRVVETSIMLANQGEHESYCAIGERNGGRKGHSMYMEVRSPNDLIVKTKWDIL